MVSRTLRPSLVVMLVLGTSSSCLLLADPPDLVEQCVDDEIGDVVGESVAKGRTVRSTLTYECSEEDVGSSTIDYVFEWTAPDAQAYEFILAGSSRDLRIGVTSPTCGGPIEDCSEDVIVQYSDEPSMVVYETQAGEVLHIVVQYRDQSNYGDESEFTLSIVPYVPSADPPTEPDPPACPYYGDGECDEPEGTNLCAEGTDPLDYE